MVLKETVTSLLHQYTERLCVCFSPVKKEMKNLERQHYTSIDIIPVSLYTPQTRN